MKKKFLLLLTITVLANVAMAVEDSTYTCEDSLKTNIRVMYRRSASTYMQYMGVCHKDTLRFDTLTENEEGRVRIFTIDNSAQSLGRFKDLKITIVEAEFYDKNNRLLAREVEQLSRNSVTAQFWNGKMMNQPRCVRGAAYCILKVHCPLLGGKKKLIKEYTVLFQ